MMMKDRMHIIYIYTYIDIYNIYICMKWVLDCMESLFVLGAGMPALS